MSALDQQQYRETFVHLIQVTVIECLRTFT